VVNHNGGVYGTERGLLDLVATMQCKAAINICDVVKVEVKEQYIAVGLVLGLIRTNLGSSLTRCRMTSYKVRMDIARLYQQLTT
jgi:hypothetical protein